MEPLVSIVTPSYNCERYIEETILSVVEQGYPKIEHIVVDGASQDKTIDILKRYDGQIKWISEADSGMYEAINKGFAMAKGEILTYINSDDSYYSKDTISFIVKEFKKDDSIDFIFGHCAFIDEAGRTLYIYKAPPFNRKIALAYPRILFHQPTCFWRKRVHKGFNSSFRYCADSLFFCYLCKYHQGKNIKRIIAKFRVRKDCLAFMNKEEMAKEGERIFGPNAMLKVSFHLKVYDLVYIRTILNLRANIKRFLLYCQKRPYL
jgi:glycosyltransferase involved in cell wall biosynthesis